MFSASTSTGFGKIRGENEKPVDVEAGSSQKVISAEQPKIEPIPAKEPASEPADIVIGKDPEGETIL
jgi:hypothetical protein